MTVYNKIFTKILDSSIWLETDATRLVWLTLIASMDEHGIVQFASVKNLAHRTRVSEDAAIAAVKTLESPDPDSSDPDNEGRRIERIPGGWIVLNAKKYRDLVTRAVAQEKTRARVAKFRAKNNPDSGNADVTVVKRPVTPSEAVSETKAEAETPNPSSEAPPAEAKAPRPRNLVMDKLAEVCGMPPSEIGPVLAKRLQRVITTIKQSTPTVDPAQIERRAHNYHRMFPECKLTPEAMEKHWTVCSIESATATPFAQKPAIGVRPPPLVPAMR